MTDYVSGVVDKLMTGIETKVFSTKELGRSFMNTFLKKVMIML